MMVASQANLLGIQLGGSFAILLTGICGAFLPYLLIKCKSSDGVLTYLNAISAGILLGAAFIHMVPEITGKLDAVSNGFPISYTFFCMGIFLMVWLSRIGGHTHQHQPIQSSFPRSTYVSIHSCTQSHSKIQRRCENVHCHDNNCTHVHEISSGGSLVAASSSELVPHKEVCGCELSMCKTCDQEYPVEIDPDCERHMNRAASDAAINRRRRRCNQLRSVLLLLLGLSVHALTAGLSLGFSKTMDQAMGIFFAVILHKWCETCTQSLSGIRNGLSLKINAAITVSLSLVTPVGTWIGILLQSTHKVDLESNTFDYVSDSLIMFVAGTFIQIVFEEILQTYIPNHSTNKRDTSCSLSLRMVAMLLGFIFMCTIAAVEHVLNDS